MKRKCVLSGLYKLFKYASTSHTHKHTQTRILEQNKYMADGTDTKLAGRMPSLSHLRMYSRNVWWFWLLERVLHVCWRVISNLFHFGTRITSPCLHDCIDSKMICSPHAAVVVLRISMCIFPQDEMKAMLQSQTFTWSCVILTFDANWNPSSCGYSQNRALCQPTWLYVGACNCVMVTWEHTLFRSWNSPSSV